MANIDERKLEQALIDLLDGHETDAEAVLAEVEQVRTYEEAGVLTRDHGVVIRAAGGWEFQVTIHVSRRGVGLVSCPCCGAEYDEDGSEIDEQGQCDACRDHNTPDDDEE